MKKSILFLLPILALSLQSCNSTKTPSHETFSLAEGIYTPPPFKSLVASHTHLKKGMKAPDFLLHDLKNKPVRLSDYRGKQNVVISFVPSAWTPVCSGQWPGYNLVLDEVFTSKNTQLLGITASSTPAIYAWTQAMGGLKFPVMSDFYPHGKVISKYGFLRPKGFSDRAVVIIDKAGIIQFIKAYPINKRPSLDDIVEVLDRLNK